MVLHKHIGAIPQFATYRAIIVRYPIETSTKEFCETIATSIARDMKSISVPYNQGKAKGQQLKGKIVS